MSERVAGLDVEQRGEGGAVTLRLAGELDIASAARLQDTVVRVCAERGAHALTIDLRGLAFIDSTGLAAIVYASRLCERHECDLALIRGAQSVQRVFDLTGLSALLPFEAAGAADVHG